MPKTHAWFILTSAWLPLKSLTKGYSLESPTARATRTACQASSLPVDATNGQPARPMELVFASYAFENLAKVPATLGKLGELQLLYKLADSSAPHFQEHCPFQNARQSRILAFKFSTDSVLEHQLAKQEPHHAAQLRWTHPPPQRQPLLLMLRFLPCRPHLGQSKP